jgi:hypothetical protein
LAKRLRICSLFGTVRPGVLAFFTQQYYVCGSLTGIQILEKPYLSGHPKQTTLYLNPFKATQMTKTRIQLFFAVVLLMATFLSVYAFTEMPDRTSNHIAAGKEALIKGEGTYTDGATSWSFAVNAAQQQDGSITGSMQWEQDGQRRSINIDCLKFDGSIVYLSGKDSAARPVTFVLYDSWESRRSDLISSPIENIGCGGDVYSAAYSFNRLATGKLHVVEP